MFGVCAMRFGSCQIYVFLKVVCWFYIGILFFFKLLESLLAGCLLFVFKNMFLSPPLSLPFFSVVAYSTLSGCIAPCFRFFIAYQMKVCGEGLHS